MTEQEKRRVVCIGLRSTCTLIRVVMGRWDCKWKERMATNNVKVEDMINIPAV